MGDRWVDDEWVGGWTMFNRMDGRVGLADGLRIDVYVKM